MARPFSKHTDAVGWLEKNLLVCRLDMYISNRKLLVCVGLNPHSCYMRYYMSINEPEFGKDVSIVFLIKVSKRVPYHGCVCVR